MGSSVGAVQVVAAWVVAWAAVTWPSTGVDAQEASPASCPGGLDLATVLEAHGAARIGEVRSLDFTFHVQTPDGEIARDWHWDRVRDEVSLGVADSANPADVLAFSTPAPGDASDEVRQADRGFVNDRYWLLFPVQLGWEEEVEVTVECAPQPLPLGGGEAPRFTVVYTGSGGYTPGDAYDFYPDPSGRILQWTFRRGGAADPTITVSFDDYAEVGPLTLSLTRRNAEGQPRIWFTDVSATTDELEHEVGPAE